ncbi:discoidin domain-containing protein [Streptomyces brasiliensis]|nr:discoidin domain-containing protein [Streptomyces brasiliensis]
MEFVTSRRTLLRAVAAAASLGPVLGNAGGAHAAGRDRAGEARGTHGLTVPEQRMRGVYETALTPYKYGVVLENDLGFVDGPCVFRIGSAWYMTYFVLHGQDGLRNGYTTELARSEDLLHWEPLGTLLPFRSGAWDAAQAAGSIALPNTAWGASHPHTYGGRYWMSYFGGDQEGFEPGPLALSMASSATPLTPSTWTRRDAPVLAPGDADARWWENYRHFRSTVIHDPGGTLGAPFVMFYNARGGTRYEWTERIGLAVSNDMTSWTRYRTDPVISNPPLDSDGGISGDPQIVRMGDVWVMFYFGAFWRNGAFNTFACSYDLVNWTKWSGPMLLAPTEGFDRTYAHKPWVVQHEGTVYHFYTAVGDKRSIAVATSRDLSSRRRTGAEQVTASYTHWKNSVTSVRDGSTDPGTSSQDIWTAFETPNFYDWVEVAFPRPRSVSGLRLHVHDDGAHIRPPRHYDVEVDAGGGWVTVSGQARVPADCVAGANTVTFSPVTARRIRLYLHHRRGGVQPSSGGTYSGLTEIEIL